MKYLLFILVIFVFSQCTTPPVGANVPRKAYLVFTANDSLNACFEPQHVIDISSQDGNYSMIDKSIYTTDEFDIFVNQTTVGFSISNDRNRCNNITVELFVEGTLVDSKSYYLGMQDCIGLCSDGISVTSYLDVP